MFCPKCSQQQVSDQARFCSRCGFQLGVVKALLTVADDLTATHPIEMQSRSRPVSKRDMTIGATLMMAVALFAALVTIDFRSGDGARFLVVILFWMALSLLINLVPLMRAIGRYFREEASSRPLPAARNSALGPAESPAVSSFTPHRVNTAGVPQPSSVTEQTTGLLGDN
jgi:ABC-type multidrug transport system fused ATPase/permease subunit